MLCTMLEPSEICVLALSVVCSDNVVDNSIRDVALRTFFVFGGEPQLQSAELGVHPELRRNTVNGTVLNTSAQNFQSPRINGMLHSPRGNVSIANFSSLRSPLRTSTPEGLSNAAMSTPAGYIKNAVPYSPMAMGDHSIVAGANVVPSPRHDALYIYFSRIINPVWGEGRVMYGKIPSTHHYIG
uniref:Uncharacterized protein n=1 Tax=Ditylenchus dipsaci TaxID=166011 RepID=A0A915ESV9_9BILA